MMNKDDFVKELARREKTSLGEAAKWTDAILNTIMYATKNKGGVKFVGFGNFENVKTAARLGRNPQTGVQINIPENRKPKFSPGKPFEDMIALKNAKTTPVESGAEGESAAASEGDTAEAPKTAKAPRPRASAANA